MTKNLFGFRGFLLVCTASVACLAFTVIAADEPNLLPASDATADEHAVVGTIERRWNEKRQRHDFTILDERDDIFYTVLSGAGVDRTSLVGQRVALSGRTRLHDGLAEGLIYPREVQVLDNDVRQASLLWDDASTESRRVASQIPTDININIDNSGPPPVGTGTVASDRFFPGFGGPGFGAPGSGASGFQVPGFQVPGLGPECESCGRGGFLNGGGVWGRVDYLYWKTSGLEVPPLVTSSPDLTLQDNAGVLGIPGTQTRFGGGEALDDHRHGGRLRAGVWLGPQFGLEAEYLRLANEATGYSANTASSSILAVPFFNVNPRDPLNPALFAPSREDAYLISFPTVIEGSVAVSTENRFSSGGLRALLHLGGHSPGINCPEDRRVDLIFGYRTLRLDDQLAMRSQLTTLNGTNQMFDINDSFRTKNKFHGVETGAQVQGHWRRVSYEFLAKVALGNANQEIAINGNTDITAIGGGTTSHVGGLFAQSSNIGNYARDQFTVVPELGATLGIDITKRFRATLGYNFIYWSRVVRAANQIDREINQDLLPPGAVPFTGPQRPELVFRDTSFWAQGINLGLDFRW